MPFPLACSVFAEKAADSLMGFPLYVTVFFFSPLAASKILYDYFLPFKFYMSWCGPPLVDFVGRFSMPSGSRCWLPPPDKEVFSYYSFK